MNNKRRYFLFAVIAFMSVAFGSCSGHFSKDNKTKVDSISQSNNRSKIVPSIQEDTAFLGSIDSEKAPRVKKIMVITHCSKKDAQRALNDEVWIGMDFTVLTCVRGEPDHVKVSNDGTGDRYQYCWNGRIPSCVSFKKDGAIIGYD